MALTTSEQTVRHWTSSPLIQQIAAALVQRKPKKAVILADYDTGKRWKFNSMNENGHAIELVIERVR